MTKKEKATRLLRDQTCEKCDFFRLWDNQYCTNSNRNSNKIPKSKICHLWKLSENLKAPSASG